MTREEYEIRLKDAFTPGLKKASGELSNFEKKVGGVNSALSKLGVGLSFAAIGAGIKKLSDLGSEAEKLKTSFEVLTGSKEAGNSLLSQLKEYANITPYVTSDVTEASKVMLGFGIAQEKILPTMKMLGDVASGDANRLQSLALVYGQINAAGRLMGQDLLQLINNGFNPLQVISKKTGISMADLKKKMEDGAISARDVEKAFKAATSEGGLFFEMTDKQSQTFGGKMSTLADKLEIIFTNLGSSLNKVFSPILDKALEIIDKSGSGTSAIKSEQTKQAKIFEGRMLVDSYKMKGNKEDLEKLESIFPNLIQYDKNGKASGVMPNASDILKQESNFDLEKAQFRLRGLNAEIERQQKGINENKLFYGNAETLKQLVAEREDIKKAIAMNNPKTYAEAIMEKLNRSFGNIQQGSDFDVTSISESTAKGKKKGAGANGSAEERLGGTKNITINIQKLIGIENAENVDPRKIGEAVKAEIMKQLHDANLAVMN